MEKISRRKFSADFKAKIAIEAIKERYSLEELSRKHEIHPSLVAKWKREFLANASLAFSSNDDASQSKQEQEKIMDKLYSQIGQQKVEIDWLKKKLQ